MVASALGVLFTSISASTWVPHFSIAIWRSFVLIWVLSIAIRVERFGVTDIPQLLVRITQIAGRDQDTFAIHGGVVIVDFRFFLFLLLYGGLAGRHTEQSAENRRYSRKAMHDAYFFFTFLRGLRRKWGITSLANNSMLRRTLRGSVPGRSIAATRCVTRVRLR